MNKLRISVPLMKITAVAKLTGISGYWLRKGCVSGEIPCVRTTESDHGSFYINVPKFLDSIGLEYEYEMTDRK